VREGLGAVVSVKVRRPQPRPRSACLVHAAPLARHTLPRESPRPAHSPLLPPRPRPQVPSPEFEGQTKTRLGNPEVRRIVDTLVTRVRRARGAKSRVPRPTGASPAAAGWRALLWTHEPLLGVGEQNHSTPASARPRNRPQEVSDWLEQHPPALAAIVAKALTAARAADAARRARELVRRKNVLTRSTLPGKLADCTSSDRCSVGGAVACGLVEGTCWLRRGVVRMRGRLGPNVAGCSPTLHAACTCPVTRVTPGRRPRSLWWRATAPAAAPSRRATGGRRCAARAARAGALQPACRKGRTLLFCAALNPSLRCGDSLPPHTRAPKNTKNQAILPLRGKILNVERKDDAALYKNAELAALIVALGLGAKGGGGGGAAGGGGGKGGGGSAAATVDEEAGASGGGNGGDVLKGLR
jgi:hypothetical protein